MSRGKGFQRPVYQRAALVAPSPVRRGVVAMCTAMSLAQPKTVPRRRPTLLSIANGKPCLLRVRGVCQGGTASTVACHSNLAIHGKAGARKADDCYSVWGCQSCHTWLDQGPAPAELKESVFMLALLDQVTWWRQLAAAASSTEQRAATWALLQLDATPIGATP